MMQKEFVSYEHALALKKLGFNEPCFGKYDIYGSFDHKLFYHNHDSETSLNCSAPLYQQAFRWFREKHKLISDIEYQPINSQKWGFLTYVLGEEPDYEHWFYETYEEAEQACLDELIKLVKDGNTSN